jgi:hypothetical protein
MPSAFQTNINLGGILTFLQHVLHKTKPSGGPASAQTWDAKIAEEMRRPVRTINQYQRPTRSLVSKPCDNTHPPGQTDIFVIPGLLAMKKSWTVIALCSTIELAVLSVIAAIVTAPPEILPTLEAGPQIYVAGGLLNCGAPFAIDPCTTGVAYYTQTVIETTSTYGWTSFAIALM